MAGVIEHVRPPRCPKSGADVDYKTIVAQGKAYTAQCPDCSKVLWLNKHIDPYSPTDLMFTFPEHIGLQET